ncbi:MAG TPA: gamma-glutamylcyclotransferase family protein [Candidatus Saccharimonadales bacterium]|nr:gamma-glutamylcyclotransferase family protein [Candidatus Saccharimonadales bacterium]
MYYFAYGSNLSTKQMIRRCPHARVVGKARLSNYTLAFSGFSPRWQGGVATIIPQPGAEVLGVVYALDQHCLEQLDGFEGVHLGHYYRQTILVTRTDTGTEQATITYIRSSYAASRPTTAYRTTILEGAREHGLAITLP